MKQAPRTKPESIHEDGLVQPAHRTKPESSSPPVLHTQSSFLRSKGLAAVPSVGKPGAAADTSRYISHRFVTKMLQQVAEVFEEGHAASSTFQDPVRIERLKQEVAIATQALFPTGPAVPAADQPIPVNFRKGAEREESYSWLVDHPYADACDTPAKRMDEFLKRRDLPNEEISFKFLMGLGVCAVISGEYSGWNVGIANAGYAGFWIANIAAALMYLSLALCLGELSQSIPATGGANAFARAVFKHPAAAFVLGVAELTEYLMFSSLLLSMFAGLICRIYHFSTDYSPLIWIVMIVFCGYSIAFYNRLSWNLMYIGMVFCAMQIVAFALFFAGSGKVSSREWLAVGWPEGTTPSHMVWGTGFLGICQALPPSLWWFTGFECLSSCSVEAPDKRDMPKALIGCWIYLALCGILLSATSVLIPPGAFAMSQALFPAVSAIMAFASVQYYEIVLLLCIVPSVLFNMLAMLFCASRQMWTLSRIGFFPAILSLTHNRHKTPRHGLVVSCSFCFVVCMVLFYVAPNDASNVLLNLTIFAASVQYIGIALTTLAFYSRFPAAPRSFKNPLGKVAPIIIIVVSTITLLVYLASTILFFYCVLLYVAICGLLYWRWQQRNEPLLPTADAMMDIFWR